VTVGPLIHAGAAAKVARHVADAVARGATLHCGGAVDAAQGAAFFQPTLLSGVAPDAALCCEETFGPLAALVRVRDSAEALAAANAVSAGLAAYVFGGEAGELFRTAEALQAGMVGVNSHLVSTVAAPFGGVRDSGHGKEGSSHGINEYMEVRRALAKHSSLSSVSGAALTPPRGCHARPCRSSTLHSSASQGCRCRLLWVPRNRPTDDDAAL
jgi:succinate-semialdehyde dehydrogenase/glutarate-semialdehyde dehydrogenase